MQLSWFVQSNMQSKSKTTVFAKVADRTNLLHNTQRNVVSFIKPFYRMVQ